MRDTAVIDVDAGTHLDSGRLLRPDFRIAKVGVAHAQVQSGHEGSIEIVAQTHHHVDLVRQLRILIYEGASTR